MIKLMPAESGSFHNFKCGEVFCLSSEQYDITCCLCGAKVELLDFPEHFQDQHLSNSLNKSNCQESSEKDSFKRVQNKTNTQSNKAALNEETLNIKPEFDEEVSAFSWDEHFQDDEVPIDMDAMENTLHVDEDFLDEKEKNQLLDIGEMGAKTEKFCGDGDDDEIDIGIESDEWLHEKYSYDNVLTDEDDPAELEGIDITDIKFNIYDTDDESDEFDDDIKILNCDTDDKNNDKEITPLYDIETVPCEYCKRVFNSKIGLKIHIKAVHKNGPPIKGKSKPKSLKEYKCEDCDEKFLTERALTTHRYKHTGIFCNICGKTFSQIGNLVRHRIRHTGEKPFQCEECDKTFFTERERKAHMMRHTGILPIICEICGKRCRDHGVLTAHMRRHTGERPAKCNICGKSFFCGYDLNVHSVTHSTERPFKCDICGSTFQLKKSLRVHKKIHSKDRNHPCRICGKSFAQSSGLTSHMRMHDTANTCINNKLFEGIDSADDITDIAAQASSAAIVDVSVAHDGAQWNLL